MMLELTVLVSVALLACIVVLVFGCSCFGKSPPFKSFEDEPEDPREPYAESGGNQDGDNTSLVTFEPLPDILAKAIPSTTALRPRITCIATDEEDFTPRIVPIQQAFPRKQLTYITEMGMGWFGQVVQGVADNVLVGIRQSKVVVQVLRDDASALEMQKFLQEVAVYRAIDHPNILRLLGMCTEAIPFLVLFEYFPLGDLKTYLMENEKDIAYHKQRKILLRFAIDIACGLACLHRHNYVHCDLALRNCLVTNDLNVKIGDYGLSEEKFKEDYYDTGCDLLPVRWMAPETLTLQKGVWRTKPFTVQANIWSYGVTMWEMTQLCRQPYHWLTDEQVLEKVISKRTECLPLPYYAEDKLNIYELMKMCWREEGERPTIEELHKDLLNLQISLKYMEEVEFEKNWGKMSSLSPINTGDSKIDLEPESMEIATDALEMFSGENEAAASSEVVGDIPVHIPIDIPIEDSMTITMPSYNLLTFNNSDLVTEINTETENRLLAELESETNAGMKCVAIVELDHNSKKQAEVNNTEEKERNREENKEHDDAVDGTIPIKKMKKISSEDSNDGRDSSPSQISSVESVRAILEKIQELSPIKKPDDDDSGDEMSPELSQEMADIYYQRHCRSSGSRRSNLKVTPLAPIPENSVPVDNFSDNYDVSYTRPLEEPTSIQDSYEWDELVGGQLIGKTTEGTPSPRRSLDFSEWSVDSMPVSQSKPPSLCSRSRQSSISSEFSDIFGASEFNFGSDSSPSASGTGLNAYSIASEILTSRVIKSLNKKNPPRRTFYSISSLSDVDLDNLEDSDESPPHETPLSSHSKYSTSQDLTTIGKLGDYPESSSSLAAASHQEKFYNDLLERLSSTESYHLPLYDEPEEDS